MTPAPVVLVRGQNHPLPSGTLRIDVQVDAPCALAALLTASDGRIRSARDLIGAVQATGPGVVWYRHAGAATTPQLVVDPRSVPDDVERIVVALGLGGTDTRFGQLSPPTITVSGMPGTSGMAAAGVIFTMTDLDAERALIALELYRRAGAWKVRAVGQGYADGAAKLLAEFGADETVTIGTLGAVLTPAVPAPAPQAPAGRNPSGPASEDRHYEQVWSVFEDTARALSAFRSASDYAVARREDELTSLLAQTPPGSPGFAAAREQAHRRHDDLMTKARAAFDRDTAQLRAELDVMNSALPPALARWDNVVWAGWRPAGRPAAALRAGDLRMAEQPDLAIPLLFRLPLGTGLWIDSGGGARVEASALALALITRLLAAYPLGSLSLQVIDPGGSTAPMSGLQAASWDSLLAEKPASEAMQITAVLSGLVERVELLQLAARSDGWDSLPPGMDLGGRLLVVYDFPLGLDDRSINRLRYLLEEGPAVGVHLLMVADRDDAAGYGPLLDPLWRVMTRLPAVPEDHLVDPWVGLAWMYVPDGLEDIDAVTSMLARIAAARAG